VIVHSNYNLNLKSILLFLILITNKRIKMNTTFNTITHNNDNINDDDILLEELNELNFSSIINSILLFLKNGPKSFSDMKNYFSTSYTNTDILQALDIAIKLNKIKMSKKANRLLGDQLYSLY
jgi:hypothetical protein